MKKSLVALAVLAAAGTSFAQSSVTLSGSYAFGFSSNNIATVKKSGFGTDTAAIKLVATEDLGGGLKASGQVTLGGMQRDGAGTGEDAQMTLSGGFGSLRLGTIEAGNGIRGRAQAGAPVFNLEGEVYGPAANIDILSYTSPSFGGATFGVSYVDRGETTAVGTGIGAGSKGPSGAQPSFTLGAAYANGPINVGLDATSWTRKNVAAITPSVADSRFRVSGNYNFGFATLGAGFSSSKTTTNVKTDETGFGVSAPLGPVTVGAFAATSKTGTVKKSGTTFGVNYALSKRTSISSNVASWKASSVAPKDSRFGVVIAHGF